MSAQHRLVTVIAFATLLAVPALSAHADTGIAVGFGGYAMTDQEPLTATTITFNIPKVLIGASLSFRTGESVTNVLVAGKALFKVKEAEGTIIGVGGSLAFLTDAFAGTDTATGIGLGGGLEQRIGKSVALSVDLYPVSIQTGGSTTRIGILSSGAIGVSYYFK